MLVQHASHNNHYCLRSTSVPRILLDIFTSLLLPLVLTKCYFYVYFLHWINQSSEKLKDLSKVTQLWVSEPRSGIGCLTASRSVTAMLGPLSALMDWIGVIPQYLVRTQPSSPTQAQLRKAVCAWAHQHTPLLRYLVITWWDYSSTCWGLPLDCKFLKPSTILYSFLSLQHLSMHVNKTKIRKMTKKKRQISLSWDRYSWEFHCTKKPSG